MYCKHCGKDTEEPIASSSPDQSITKKSMPAWFKALVCVVALSIGALLTSTFLTEDLTDTVKSQLKAIRAGELSEAYNYTSKKFQEATPFESFSAFIKKHPAFAENKSIHFKERNVNNDVGTLDSVMITHRDKKMIVEYKLIKEAGTWKILSIRLEDVNKNLAENDSNYNKQIKFNLADQKNSLKFSQFVLGNSLSPLGLIKTPSQAFKSNAGDIYLNLYVKDATAGNPVQVFFEHLNTHSTLNPVTTHTTSEGEAILSFVFSPPDGQWPAGDYRIKASTTNNNKASIDFKID